MNSWRLTCLACRFDHKWKPYRKTCRWAIIKERSILLCLALCGLSFTHHHHHHHNSTIALTTVTTTLSTKTWRRRSWRESGVPLTLPGCVHDWGLSISSGVSHAQRTWKGSSMALSPLESLIVKASVSKACRSREDIAVPLMWKIKLNA